MQQGSKNNACLSSLIPHVAVLKKFFNHYVISPPGKSIPITLATLAEYI